MNLTRTHLTLYSFSTSGAYSFHKSLIDVSQTGNSKSSTHTKKIKSVHFQNFNSSDFQCPTPRLQTHFHSWQFWPIYGVTPFMLAFIGSGICYLCNTKRCTPESVHLNWHILQSRGGQLRQGAITTGYRRLPKMLGNSQHVLNWFFARRNGFAILCKSSEDIR